MSFKPQDILFVSPLDRHEGTLTAVRDALGGGEVQCGTGFSEAVRQGFRTGRPLVGLCAAGILIRLVAPLLTDKHAEPPVLVMTETGDFVPLLGGHHGANRLARELAEAASGFALVSTATDALLGAPVEDPAPGYRLLNPQHAGAFQKALTQSPSGIAIKGEWPLRSDAPEAAATAGTAGTAGTGGTAAPAPAAPTASPDAATTASPEALLEAVRVLHVAEPELGLKPLLAKLREQQPGLAVGTKEVRKALAALKVRVRVRVGVRIRVRVRTRIRVRVTVTVTVRVTLTKP